MIEVYDHDGEYISTLDMRGCCPDGDCLMCGKCLAATYEDLGYALIGDEE